MQASFLDFGTLGPDDIDVTKLTRLLPNLVLHKATSPDQVVKRIAEAEIVIINKVQLDAAALKSAKRLKLICFAATGTDNVNLEFAAREKIAVCNIRDYCTASVAQHVFALILALNQHLREYDSLLNRGAWRESSQFCLLDYPITELAGKTLGIVGLGALGHAVAKIGHAFNMNVLARQRDDKNHSTNAIRHVSLGRLLEESDIVSLHCPLNKDTHHIIDARALARMQSNALLINTARGGLINSAALVRALEENRIGGAGIDVLLQEPPVHGDPLLDARLPNLIVTPHIAWATRESRQRALDEIAANVADFMNGGRRNRVE
jgi:glycerate dehydrogenase